MTTGERIAQKRKENNLSQEALGEALGVSRQSISKWESNLSLPEIEKLVALSRLFGVSVGWLLGVEEEERRPEEAAGQAEGSGGELTEEQLRMVEEIVARYIAAQPKPRTLSRRQRAALKIGLTAAGVCLAMGLFWLSGQMNQMENQYNNLQYALDRVTDSVNSQIDGIGSRVEEILQAQNNLTADYDARQLETDVAAGTVTIEAWAVPKTFRAGMTAEFLAECDGEQLAFPAELEAQTFSAILAVPLVDDIRVSVVFQSGDTRETQLLRDFGGLYSQTIPPAWLMDAWAFDDAHWEDGVLTVPANTFNVTKEWEDYAEDGTCADVAELKLGLFRNRELVAWGEEIPKPESYGGSGWEQDLFFQFPELTVPCEEGDTLCYALMVTDEYGRTTVRGGQEYQVAAASGAEGEMAVDRVGAAGYYTYDDPADWGL